MPKITLLSDLICSIHFHARNGKSCFVRSESRAGAGFLFFRVFREKERQRKTNRDNNKLMVCIIRKCLRISLCYYLIFFYLLFAPFLLFPFLIQISRGLLRCMREKTSEKKKAKNNEKRHNYMHACIIFLFRLMVVPSSYDNYTIKTHKFSTQKSVFLHSLLLSLSLGLFGTRKESKNAKEIESIRST